MLRFSLQKERGKVKSAAALNHFYFTIKLEQRLVGIFNNTPPLPAHSPLHPVSSFFSLVSFSVFIQIILLLLMEKLQQVSAVVKCHLKEKTATVMSSVSLWFILIVPMKLRISYCTCKNCQTTTNPNKLTNPNLLYFLFHVE